MDPLDLAGAAADAPDRLALLDAAGGLTYRALHARVRDRVEALDLHRADRVMVTPRPARGPVLDLLAGLEARSTVVLAHPRWTAAERRDAETRLLPTVVIDPDGRVTRRPPRIHPRRPQLVVHTSGSSGRPKAIALSRPALVAAAEAHGAHLPWAAEDRWLLAMPPAHIGGVSILTRCAVARRTVVLRGKLDLPGLLAAIEEASVTLLSMVPTTLTRLVEGGISAPPSLRAVLVGGAAASPALLDAGRALGWPLHATYGMSEASAQVCTQREPSEPGCGTPLPGVALRIDAAGEIFVRGPSLYSHYEPPRWYADPRRDGWYGTGDLGRWRDGGLEVLGRRDDRIVSGGENVDPIEVEAALEALPEVAGAVVFGLPDREWGERVAAAVVLRAPAPTDELRRSLADRLATYKHPRRWFVVSELPVTRAGKKDRRGAARRLG